MTNTKTATLITIKPGFTPAERRLYRLSEPLEGHDFVLVCAIHIVSDTGHPETYIFPSNEAGTITDWTELPGSIQGVYDHAQALAGAGYELARES